MSKNHVTPNEWVISEFRGINFGDKRLTDRLIKIADSFAVAPDLKRVSQLQECKQARRVANNILKLFDMMWLFIENPEIEPTNNFAKGR